ncbi:putative hydrolases or acyltransferase [Polyplosphaeria fusca]|uniref:Hydrolases or acyltransferase n=1 Tax=Polyplosphaeria fusca TaxID=682080 RepID=A0A9P4QRJ6_9PLEO|nr:putative hydrolases or acyltransferase [Polyplosphaeria fusca]
MPYLTTNDSVQLFYKDWGNVTGPPVFLSHGWPLNSDNWENQMFFLANQGYRAVAYDRRGHGRSDQPWFGNDVDTWAGDIAQIIEELDLKDTILIGHSTGGGDITRYVTNHGSERVKGMVLIDTITPYIIQTPETPNGVPISVFDSFRDAMLKDRSYFFQQVPSGPFFGYNRPGVKPSQGQIDSWWAQGMQAGFKATYDTTFSWETDFREEMKKIDFPVLVIHGDDDQVVPFKAGGAENLKYLKNATLKVYEGGPHGLPNVEIDGINNDILNFSKSLG